MHWIYLLLAIGFEVVGTTCMKLSAGFSRTVPAIGMVVSYLACFGFLTLAIKKIQISIAYAIWSGVGTALISLIGLLWFRETLTPLKLFGLFAILVGVVSLNLSGGTH
jgi:small multidrug resistance pump